MIYGVRKVDVTLMKKNGCFMALESGQQMNTLLFPIYCSFKKTYVLQKATS